MKTAEENQFDLVVVGSTPGGIAMAVRAAREGLSVLLTNYHRHPGGLLSSGLAVWDTLYEGKRAPLYDEVRATILEHYRTQYGEDSQEYRESLPGETGHTNGRFEAKTAEAIFGELLRKESRVTFLTPFYPFAVEREGGKLTAVHFKEMGGTDERRVAGAIFADCTYEGDLMALSGAQYSIGREPRSQYGEPHAGRIFLQNLPIDAPPPEPDLAKEIAWLNIRHFGGPQRVLDHPETGSSDGLVQAMNYRTMLSSDPANRILPEKPANYDPAFYAALEYESRVNRVPNRKMGWNRPQLVGIQTGYVEAGWEARQMVLEAHWNATIGLLYYLQNDAPLSGEQRAYWRQYGLAKDEFPDHSHRPYEIYVREARRLKGRDVFTELDGRPARGIRRPPIKADSIAITEWYFDVHACTLERMEGSMDEGKMMLHHETLPGQISWRCLLPQEIDNLLVPVCLSASHVGWGGVRLEPTWMHIGESAAWAAVLARRKGCEPADLDVDELLRAAADHHIMLTFFNDVEVAFGLEWIPAVEYFGTKGFFPAYDARPHEPLSKAVALVWREIFQKIRHSDFNPTAAAAAVSRAEEGVFVPADEADFSGIAGADGIAFPITRGKGCLLLYLALGE